MPFDPTVADGGGDAPGLYENLLAATEEHLADAADYVDPLYRHPEYTPHLSNAERAGAINAARKQERAVRKRRLDELKAGEPQLLPAHQVRRMPGAAHLEWLQDPFACTGSAPYLVRVWPDDTVEIGQTVGQHKRQQELIGARYPVGRISAEGNWIPCVQDPAFGEWHDIEPGEILDP